MKQRIRRILAAMAGLTLIVAPILVSIAWAFISPKGAPESITYNDLVQNAFDIRLKHSETLFQMAIVIMSAIAGLLIAKKDEVRILVRGWSEDWPELIMFFCASSALAVSLILHLTYVDRVSYYQNEAGKTLGNRMTKYKSEQLLNKQPTPTSLEEAEGQIEPIPTTPDILGPQINYLLQSQ